MACRRNHTDTEVEVRSPRGAVKGETRSSESIKTGLDSIVALLIRSHFNNNIDVCFNRTATSNVIRFGVRGRCVHAYTAMLSVVKWRCACVRLCLRMCVRSVRIQFPINFPTKAPNPLNHVAMVQTLHGAQ